MTNINSVSLNRKKNVEKRFWLSVAFSVVAIFLCLAALCASTYALFHKEAKSEGNVVRTAVYVLNVKLDDASQTTPVHYGPIGTQDTYVSYELTPGEHTLTITYPTGVEGNASTGFVTITVVDAHGNRTLHTVHLGTTENAVTSITLNINVLTAGGSITFAPQWGTSTDNNLVGDDATIELGHKLTAYAAVAATCTTPGNSAYWSCSVEGCEHKYFSDETGTQEINENSWVIPATGHTPAAAVEENRVEATCTAPGSYDSVVYCSVCGAELSRTPQTIPALGHNWGEWTVTEQAVAATCTEAGKTAVETRTCSRCNATETRGGETVSATGHSWGEWTQTTAPTCTEAGEETRTCSRCDATETRDVAALGHDYVAVVTDPTCTTAGYTTHTCSRCGDSYTDTPVAALGHDWGEWTVTTPATCTTAGVETRVCANDPSHTETREVAALGHAYGEPAWEWTGNDTDGYTAATAKFTCANDSSHTETVIDSSIDYAVTTAPTSTTTGVGTYTASVEHDGNTYTDTKTVTLPVVSSRSFTHSDNLAHTDTYLYRVGNGNTVTLGTLFKVVGDGTPDPANVKIKITAATTNSSVSGTVNNSNLEEGSTAKCVYTKDANNWTASTLKFTGEGPVSVEIWEGSGEHYPLNLEIVTGNNFVENATLNGNANIVLLGNVKLGASSAQNSALTLSGKSLWGNGFEIDATASNISSKAFGIISLTNSKIDNAIINGPTYDSYAGTYGSDNYAATVVCYDNAEITNCHISGAADPCCVYGTNVKVSDTILSGGVFANMHIRNRGGVTVENVTTINTQNSLGIVFYNSTSDSYIRINGYLTQHNFISQDATMSSDQADTLKTQVFKNSYSQYHFTSGGTKYANMGIISMDSVIGAAQIIDNRTDKKNYSGMSVSVFGVNGYVYTMENTDSSMLETSYTEPTYTPSTQLPYPPEFNWTVPSGDNVAAGGDAHCYKDSSGVLQIQFLTGGSKSINASNYATFKKYGGSTAIDPSTITCTKNSSGAALTVTDGSITFTEAGEYTITYHYNGVTVYDEALDTSTTVDYTKTISVNVRVKQNRPNAVITSSSDTGTIVWGKAGSTFDPDYNPCIPFLDGLTITDYDANGNAYTVLNGSSQASFISSIASVSVSGTTVTITLANGCKLVVKGPAVDGSVQIKVNSNKMYYCDSTADNNPAAFTKTFAANSYTYTGENGVAVSYNKARSFTSTTSTSAIPNYSSMTQPWTSNKFLMYDPQGGTVSPTYVSSSPATLPTPTREGYTFLNWNTKADGTGTAKAAGSSYSFSSTTTLYAIWAANVTVSFNGNGGTDPVSISGGAGTNATLPESTFNGVWLEGWYTSADGGTKIGNAGASFTMPSSDTTYYAHWSPKYTVSYNANGGTCTTEGAVYEGIALTLPTPTNGSKTFEGWFDAAEGGTKIGSAGDSYVPTADIVLFAQWSDNILVTFDGNGGTAGTNSATYDNVTPITLPTATWAGHQFNGWYTESSGGTKIGDAGASYEPTAAITLYAQWTAYTVTYDANGGSVSPASANAGSNGTVTLPTPTRTGYTFNGWYTETSGGTKIGNGGASYTPTENVTLHAQWTQQKFTVTISAGSGGSVSPTSVANVPYGTTISVSSNTLTINGTTVTATANSNYEFDKWSVSNGATVTSAMTITASFKSTGGGTGCVTGDTLVTLADGTHKPISEVQSGDMLLAWDFYNGCVVAAPVVFNDGEPEDIYEVIRAIFSDGTEVDIIYEHGFFDLDIGEFVYFDSNAAQYIGHSFVKQVGDISEVVTLVDVIIEERLTTAYDTNTYGHLCFYTNDMLSVSGGIWGLFNIFEVDVGTMTYDAEAMQNDIETYGLLTLEDFGGMITEDMFNAFNGQYLGIAVGKGQLTWEYIAYLAERYGPLCD
ncbi:MAG: InlB B-repeat-containing protein [Clostridia bacterium]|nr:InlB B-repeat-containing protein [Clostridia bacterium]